MNKAANDKMPDAIRKVELRPATTGRGEREENEAEREEGKEEGEEEDELTNSSTPCGPRQIYALTVALIMTYHDIW